MRQIAQGAELSELDADEQVVNAAADERGGLHLAPPNDNSTDGRVTQKPTGRIALVIFCVVPEELAPELYDQLAAYYEDDPNVTVIIDRRKSERRDRAGGHRGRQARDPRPAPRPRRGRVPADRRRRRSLSEARRPRGRRLAGQPGAGRRGCRAVDARRRGRRRGRA